MKSNIQKLTWLVIFAIIVSPITASTTNESTQLQQSADHNPIILLNGWTEKPSAWASYYSWFKDDGWPAGDIYILDLPKNGACYSETADLEKSKYVASIVNQIMNSTDYTKVNLVTHSYGFLPGRYYIKFLGGIDRVSNYIATAGPQHAGWQCMVGTEREMYKLNNGDETPGGILNDTIGPRIDPINNSIVYDSTHVSGDIGYTSIYSLSDGYINPVSSPLDGATNIEVTSLLGYNITHITFQANHDVYTIIRDILLKSDIAAFGLKHNKGSVPFSFNPFIVLMVLVVARMKIRYGENEASKSQIQ